MGSNRAASEIRSIPKMNWSAVAVMSFVAAFGVPVTMAAIFVPSQPMVNEIQTRAKCGGTFAEKHGVVATPNFPNPFPVPIECKWIFRGAPGDHITVYLTQFYLKEGFHAAAYGFYSDDHIFMAKDDLGSVAADESVAYISTRKPVLVLSLSLMSTENVNLRVRDRFLDVYGFNITYEMRRPRSRNFVCTVFTCSFNGHCLASSSFRFYKCQCFPGFFGANCQYGPGCDPERHVEVCQNGGRCSYVTGPTGIQCTCPPGFTGSRCETIYADGIQKQCELAGVNCTQVCSLEENKPVCSCNKGFELAEDNVSCHETGVTRYVASLKLKNLHIDPLRVNRSSSDYIELKSKIETPLSEYLQTRLTNSVELEIYGFHPGAIVEFQFLALNDESGLARDALAEIVNNGSLGNVLKFDSHFIKFEREPTLNLQKVDRDVPSPAELGWNMTLTCIATGTRELSFQWFKDGSRVAVSKAMRPCKEILWPRNSRNQYTTQLIIGNIHRIDAGVFTCRVTDWNNSQERSILVKVQTPPVVILEPPGEITILKNANFSVTCMATDDTGQNGYTWMKNGQLINDEIDIMSEDLYPDGSRLYLHDIKSRTKVTCLVTNTAGKSSASMYITPMDPEDDKDDVCIKQESFGISWPVTMRGQTSLQLCPQHHEGYSRRACDFEYADRKPTWGAPNFDNCRPSVILSLRNKLEALRFGYEVIDPTAVPEEILTDLARRAPVLPQSGVDVLHIMRETSDYMITLEMTARLRQSIQDFSHLSTAINVMQNHFSANRFGELQKTFALFRQNFAYFTANFLENDEKFPFETKYAEEPDWAIREKLRLILEKNSFPLVDADETLEVSVIFFRNLSQFLPSMYIERQNSTSTEHEHKLISEVVSVSLQKDGSEDIGRINGVLIEIEFPMEDERLNTSRWVPSCGRGRNLGPGHTISLRWEPFACPAKIVNSSKIICTCKEFGIFALLIAPSEKKLEEKSWGLYTEVTVGCVIALTILISTAFFVLLQWFRLSDPMGLSKGQEVLASIAGTSLILFSARTTLPRATYPYIITALTFSFNLIIASQFCRPIFVYVGYNLIPTLRGHRMKITILSWGLPCISTAAAMAAQEMQGWDLDSWWLVQDSMFFYGSAIPFFIVLILYFWVYFLAMSSIRRRLLEAERDTPDEKSYARLFQRAHREHSLLQRSSLVVWTTMIWFIASVYFANDPESGPKTYFLSIALIIHALANWIFYIAKSEYRRPLWRTILYVQEFFGDPDVYAKVMDGDDEKSIEGGKDHNPEKCRSSDKSKTSSSASSSKTKRSSLDTLPMDDRLNGKIEHASRPYNDGFLSSSLVDQIDVHP
ncbi:unnamed protein product [Notodromas monacha]|uniref:Uncharacterized protein n=1 Tax=Notodromas monacha TaxID=399045 RepID=A0A7R9G8P5_9CRUS|nr:unnamed protein product [Notodromas monacha]CAG0913429.1 unnamed protein product [Notodromas monacha]